MLPAALQTALSHGRIAPAYLIQGVDLEACQALAREFAAHLVAHRPDEGLRRRIDRGVHPDVHLVGKDKATVISVAALARVLEQAHQAPLEGRRQVFVVAPADALDPAGVARYLKTLEEPPPTTVFLLCTTAPGRLPATIHSRCASVPVPPETPEAIEAALVACGHDAAQAARASRVCGGARSRAILLLERELLPAIDAFLQGVMDGRRAACALCAASLSETLLQQADPAASVRDLAGEVLRVIGAGLRDRAAGRPAAGLESLSPEAALRGLARVAEGSRALAAHVAPRTVVLEVALTLHRLCVSALLA